MTSGNTKYLFDSSAWIEFFLGTKKGLVVKDVLDSKSTIITPDSCVAEVFSWCLRENKDFGQALFIMRQASQFQEITTNTWIEATRIRADLRPTRPKIGIMDALVIALQKNFGPIIVTKDTDFRGLPKTLML